MNKQELLKLADNPALIEGIYNYCDRWCERCPLTPRCLVFAMESADKERAAAAGEEEQLVHQLEESLRLTTELLADFQKEQEMQFNSEDSAAETDAEAHVFSKLEAEELSEARKIAPIAVRAARHYIDLVNDWFDSHGSLFEEKERSLNAGVPVVSDATNLQHEVDQITDAVEVIRWYQHQIFVKLMRASRNLDELAEECKQTRPDSILLDAVKRDVNGSAKVALIGVQRSTSAWLSLRGHLTDQADSILHVLIHLEKLRRNLLLAFPDAETFLRPGFDEIEKVEPTGPEERKRA
ncbi:MAG TPA: hypothetical protein VGK99_05230 [Acidobacteriota bacterium]|jgi:hypothetical protein